MRHRQQPQSARLGLRVGLGGGADWQVRNREELRELAARIPKAWEQLAEQEEFGDILDE